MKVAIDCRHILDGMSGLGMYTSRLVTALAAVAPELGIELTIFAYRESGHLLQLPADGVVIEWVPYRVEDHFRGDIWKHLTLPRLLNRMSIDVFHDPAYQLPLTRCRSRYVVTIHDLSPFRYPETNTYKYNMYWKFMTRRSLARADRIITVSGFVREELEKMFPGSYGRIDVIHEAAGPDFIPGAVDIDKLLKLGITGRYLLTAAKYEPRKNLARCIRAFLQGPVAGFPDVQLVVVGGMGWKTRDIQLLLESGTLETDRRVILTGYLPQAELLNAVRGAEAVVVPSLYEGFGLPVLEAMACGTPVLCSNASALPEVAGDAAMYFDPEDPVSIAETMQKLLRDGDLRTRMRVDGLEWSAEYSWSRAARETADVYRRVLEN